MRVFQVCSMISWSRFGKSFFQDQGGCLVSAFIYDAGMRQQLYPGLRGDQERSLVLIRRVSSFA